MAQLRWSYSVMMIPLLAGLASAGAEANNKSVCSGDSVEIFENIQINNSDTSVTLYKNGDKQRPIAWWTSSNHTIRQENLVVDEYKNIWIINVHPVDEGNYTITYDMHNGLPLEFKVELFVWVPPTICKLVMVQHLTILTVALSGKDCGKPRVSAYWKDYSGVTMHIPPTPECKIMPPLQDENVLQLQSGKEAGTYYACMKGLALRCGKSSDPSSDHCYPFNIKEGQSQSDTGSIKTQHSAEGSEDDLHTWLIVIVLLQCAGLVPVILFGIYRSHKKYWHIRERRNAEDQSEQDIPLQS